MKRSEIPQRPPRKLLIGELRSVADVLTMPLNFLGARQAAGPARTVILIPGFGTGDWSMRPLGLYLQRNGFDIEGWGLGVNRAGLDIPHTLADLGRGWAVQPIEPYRGEGGVAVLVDKMVGRVAARASALGEPVTLVGWSLGGTIAREIARDVPGAVHHVITLGSPFIGGPKYTVAGKRLENRGLNLDWIVKNGDLAGVPNVEHVEIDVPHLSMGFNRHVWRIILQTLQRAEDREGVAPFDTAKKGDTTCPPRLS